MVLILFYKNVFCLVNFETVCNSRNCPDQRFEIGPGSNPRKSSRHSKPISDCPVRWAESNGADIFFLQTLLLHLSDQILLIRFNQIQNFNFSPTQIPFNSTPFTLLDYNYKCEENFNPKAFWKWSRILA
mgnify:CR=1 FL=1